jgi:D-alanine-D-alanine ligase
MGSKLHVVVLFGGKSAEHDVSLRSARNIIASLSPERYDISAIGIDRLGRWRFVNVDGITQSNEAGLRIDDSKPIISISPGSRKITDGARTIEPDVVFPVLHGPFGEDGSMQGVLRHLNLPFVGAGVTGSSVGMDKDVMKRLLREAGIPIGSFITFRRHERIDFDAVTSRLGSPLFIKPANLGSSVGISRTIDRDSFERGIAEAFRYDTKIVIEENIVGREIELSVLGNHDDVRVSIPGEIVPEGAFYTYDSKYATGSGSRLIIPAELSAEAISALQESAERAYRILECEGFARIDFFVTSDERIYLNEINTLPGFTSISMYPMLWKESGLEQPALIDHLIKLALARYESEKSLATGG